MVNFNYIKSIKTEFGYTQEIRFHSENIYQISTVNTNNEQTKIVHWVRHGKLILQIREI